MPTKKATPAPPPRAPGGRPRKYTDEALVEAALRVMEREGYGALTIRSLAQELGTSHSTLYNYVGRVEDIEAQALHRLTARLPLPRASTPVEFRAELLEYLLATSRLLFQHPGVLFPPIGSTSWKALAEIGEQWRAAVKPYAPDEKTANLALGALVAAVSVFAETERHYGPQFRSRVGEATGKKSDPAAGLAETLDGLMDLVFPALARRKKKAAR